MSGNKASGQGGGIFINAPEIDKNTWASAELTMITSTVAIIV